MPGFAIAGSGGVVPSVGEMRRKYRWIWEAIAGNVFTQPEMLILQSAQRPNFKLEDPVMHHQQEQVYFAGKQSWEPITLVWYDAENPLNVSNKIYNWINTVVNMTTINVNPPSVYKTNAQLSMVNGFQVPNETWQIYNCWPKTCNWGELNYVNTEIATIEVVMRYDRAAKTL